MVKSTFSFGGKLLTIFLTIVIFIALCAGSLILAVTKVKVRTLAGWIGMQDYISETYDGTIIDLVSKVSEMFNGDITVNKVLEISPGLQKQVDGIVDNVEKVGLFKVDRELLYDMPVNQMTSNLMQIVVLTASLNKLADYLSVSLPDLAFIKGNEEDPVDVYTQANATEDGTIDKIFTMSDDETSPRTYYTRSETFSSVYTDDTGEEQPVAEQVETLLYTLEGVTLENNFFCYQGNKLYVGNTGHYEDESGGTAETVSYAAITQNSGVVYSAEKQEDGTYTLKLAPAENQKFYKSCPPTAEHEDGFEELILSSDGEKVYTQNIAAPYRYKALYAQLDAAPESGEYFAFGGKYYVLATQTQESGEYIVDETKGGFRILEEYRNDVLFALDYTYAETAAENASAETPVYVYTNGIGDLPVTYAISALSSFLNTKTMTMDDLSVYFGIDLNIAVLEGIKYVPLAYLSSAMTAEMNSVYVDNVIEVNASSPTILLYLAYGNGYRITGENTLEITDESQRRTIGQLTQALDGIIISSVVEIGEDSHPLLQTIGDWTLNDIGDADKIGSIPLGDVMTIVTDEDAAADETGNTVASPQILQALANIPLDGIASAIDSLTLAEIMPIDPSDSLLGNLSGSTLQTLSQDLTNLSVQKLFADSIYAYHEAAVIPPADEGDATPNRTRFAQLKAEAEALEALYPAEELYVYEKGDYTPVREFIEAYERANADVPASQDYKGILPDAIRTPYLAVTDEILDQYTDVPLYAYTDDGNGSFGYVLATQVSEWKLSEEDAQKYEGATLYQKKSEAGKTLYEEAAKNADGFYAAKTLYVWDAGTERMTAVSLDPAGLSVREEFAQTQLYTNISYAAAYDSETEYYDQGNLFTYDIGKQTWTQLPLSPAYSSDGGVKVFLGYTLPESFSLAQGTALYTYGEVAGVWKYPLTESAYEVAVSENGAYNTSTLYAPAADSGNSIAVIRLEYKDGAWKLSDEDAAAYAGKTLYAQTNIETTCAVQEIDSLVVNVQNNINKMTLKNLYEDGMVELSDPDKLDQKIPSLIPGYEGKTVGDLTINELLNLTLEMISYLSSLPTIP